MITTHRILGTMISRKGLHNGLHLKIVFNVFFPLSYSAEFFLLYRTDISNHFSRLIKDTYFVYIICYILSFLVIFAIFTVFSFNK